MIDRMKSLRIIRVDLNVFEFAKRCPNLKFVYQVLKMSAFCQKANQLRLTTYRPRWSYKLSKMVGENYLHNSDIPWVIVRYFSIWIRVEAWSHIHDQIENHKDCVFRVIGPSERGVTHVKTL